MVQYIKITEFTGVTDRDSFNNFIIKNTVPYLKEYNDIEKTVFHLPSSVTKLERYNIHKLTISGCNPESHDYNGNRVMSITFSKIYMQTLFENYQFTIPVPEVVPANLPKTDKQILFETLIRFIETSLSNEFQQFLSTI